MRIVVTVRFPVASVTCQAGHGLGRVFHVELLWGGRRKVVAEDRGLPKKSCSGVTAALQWPGLRTDKVSQ